MPGEEVFEGAVVVLVEGRVDERVEEGVGVAEPQEDALPGGGDVAGAQRAEQLGGEEGDPAEREHPDEDAHHERGAPLLLLGPRVPAGLEGGRGAPRGALHLQKANGRQEEPPLLTPAGLGGPAQDTGGPVSRTCASRESS